MHYAIQPSAGSTGGKAATASATQTYAIAALVALRAAPVGPVAVTLDTNLFSSVDDAEALAEAFALQQLGEAKVIAVGVSARSNRAVAPDSWKCVAAIAQFYNAAGTPIGVEPPANSTVVNTPDLAGPCARLAAPSTPAPDTAVLVYRARAERPAGRQRRDGQHRVPREPLGTARLAGGRDQPADREGSDRAEGAQARRHGRRLPEPARREQPDGEPRPGPRTSQTTGRPRSSGADTRSAISCTRARPSRASTRRGRRFAPPTRP